MQILITFITNIEEGKVDLLDYVVTIRFSVSPTAKHSLTVPPGEDMRLPRPPVDCILRWQ